MAGNTDVVVIGGGYAGVMAANRLTGRDDVAVTLINPRPHFVERLRLHQLLGGSGDAVVDYGDVLAEEVRLVVDTVTRIDERTVALASGGTAAYDHLIYAVGSGSADPGVPGAAGFAYPLADLEEAERLRPVVDAADAVTVVGAGPTGIEVAAELAEEGRKVTLVCGGVLGPYLHPRGRRVVAKRFATLGVAVLDGPGTTVTAVARDLVRLGGGRQLPSEVTIWAAGCGVPDLAARSGLRTDAAGRLLTDETLTSVDDVRIGAHAADTVLRRIAGESPEPINLGFFGQCISLGRRAGLFQFARRDDTAKGFHIAGRTGAKLKEFVCKSTVKHLASEAREPGSLTWVKDGTRQELLRDRRDETKVKR